MNSICKVYEPYVESRHIVCLDEVRREVMSDEFKKLVGNDEVKIEDHVRYLRRWDSVLSQVSQLKLHRNKLENLYEQVFAFSSLCGIYIKCLLWRRLLIQSLVVCYSDGYYGEAY